MPDVLPLLHQPCPTGHRRAPASLSRGCFFSNCKLASDWSHLCFDVPKWQGEAPQRLHPRVTAASVYVICLHSLFPKLKLDEILTSKLQHSLFLFCSMQALKHIALFHAAFWGSVMTPGFLWVFFKVGTALKSQEGNSSGCQSPRLRLLFV